MVVTICILVALLLGLIDQFRAKGQALTTWAVIFLAVAVLMADTGFSL